MKKIRKLSYHPGYSTYPPCACILIGNREIAKKYNWCVGDLVELEYQPEGILIRRIGSPIDKNQLSLSDVNDDS